MCDPTSFDNKQQLQFEFLPHILNAFEKEKVLPQYLLGSIRYIDNDPKKLLNLLTQIIETELSEFKMGILYRHMGHTTPLVIERDELGNIYIINTDSVAFQGSGCDELPDMLKSLIITLARLRKAESISVELYMSGNTLGEQKIRQYQEGVCTSFSLTDLILLLSSPAACEYIKSSKNRILIEREDSPKNACAYEISQLPRILMLLSQSVKGCKEGASLSRFISEAPTFAYKHIKFTDKYIKIKDVLNANGILTKLCGQEVPANWGASTSKADSSLEQENEAELNTPLTISSLFLFLNETGQQNRVLSSLDSLYSSLVEGSYYNVDNLERYGVENLLKTSVGIDNDLFRLAINFYEHNPFGVLEDAVAFASSSASPVQKNNEGSSGGSVGSSSPLCFFGGKKTPEPTTLQPSAGPVEVENTQIFRPISSNGRIP